MPLTIRRRCRGVRRAAGAMLTGALFLLPAALTDSTPSAVVPNVASPEFPIIVNSRLAQAADADKINLPRALALAGQDPRNNVIRFDPAVFAGGPTVVLNEPLVPASGRTGDDRLEGPADGALVTLDASRCPDAGLVLGDGAQLAIWNVAIRGGAQRAVLLKDQARLTLRNVAIVSGGGPGLAMFGQAQAELDHCRLEQARTHGLEIHGECTAVLKSVRIADNQQSGVAAFEKATVRAEKCRIDGNGHWNLVMTGHARADLEGCTLRGARFANADIGETSRLVARACVIEEGARFGLFATGESQLEVRFSQISRHGSRGIEMQNQAGLVLEGSEVDSNGDYGVILFEQCSIRAAGSKFLRNQGHGVSLRGHSSGDFRLCLFAGNRYSGLGCLDAQDGGKVRASQCLFQGNGMRPIYRGPLHLDPMVPTPLSIDAERVECVADPNAVIELYLDRAGEASRYLKTIRADSLGRFQVSRIEVPVGWVMGATATAGDSTSELNVIAGSPTPDVLGALLARTGPLSDTGGDTDLDGGLRRWRPGTKLILHIPSPPSVAVERYARVVADHVDDWTRGALRAELCVGATPRVESDEVIIPVEYLASDAPALMGRGGVTFMKWDAQGYFTSPMKILLATGKQAQETCPRVLAHEFGHVLGLCHARVGLLSRMQGSMQPTDAFVNDFSPMLTFYDVLALHILHSPQWQRDNSATLRQVVSAGLLPTTAGTAMASAQPDRDQPTYSPPAANQPAPAEAHRAQRP